MSAERPHVTNCGRVFAGDQVRNTWRATSSLLEVERLGIAMTVMNDKQIFKTSTNVDCVPELAQPERMTGGNLSTSAVLWDGIVNGVEVSEPGPGGASSPLRTRRRANLTKQ